jgi:hypothetical protein
VDAARHLLELFDRLGDGSRCAAHASLELCQLLRHRGGEGAELEAERDQPLLRAVVEISFDATAGVVGCGDHTGP